MTTDETREEREPSPQDPPDDAPEVERLDGDEQQDEAADEPAGPFARLSADLDAGRITAVEATRRILGALAGAESQDGSLDSDAVLVGAYPDEYDDDGNPHERRRD